MASKGLSMKVLLSLQAKEFQKGLNGIKRQLNTFKNYLSGAFALGSLTMFGRKMIEVGKDFESAMAKVKAVSNASTEEFQKMQKEAQKMGETTRYTATEAANALENLTRNGMSATDATKALSGVMQLAQANSIGLAEAADIITNALNMFGLSVSETSRVNDILSSTVSNAATNISELYEALVNAAPAAKTLGFSLEETSAAIGSLAQKGVKGAEAGTQLRMALTKMADPKIVSKLHEYGVAIDEQSMKTDGLIGTVEKLKNANLSLTNLVDIFSQKGAVGMQQLINSYEDFGRILEVTKNSAGTTARMFEQSVGSVEKELDTLKSMYEGLLVTMSQKTSGVVKGVIKLLQNLIGNFKTVGGTVMNIASVAVPLLGNKVVALGRSFKSFFTMIKTEGVITSAMIGGWITAIATLVTWVGTALVGAWTRAHQAMKEANKEMGRVKIEGEKTKDAVAKLAEQIGDGSNQSSVNNAVAKAIELFPNFANVIKMAREEAGKTKNYEKLKTVLQDIAELENLINTRDVKEQMLDAQAKDLGNKLWHSRKPFKSSESQYLDDTTIDITELIRKGLEKALPKDKDAQKEVFNLIAKDYLTNFNDIDKAISLIQERLKNYNIDLSENQLLTWLDNEFKNRSYVGEEPNYTNKGKRAQSGKQTAKEIVQIDSTITADAFKQYLNTFESAKVVNGDLKGDDYKRAMAEAAQAFADSVSGLEGVTDEQNEIVQRVLREFPSIDKKPTNTTSGEGGNGAGVTSNTEKVSNLFKDYNKEEKELKNQFINGALNANEYEDALNKLRDTTFKNISAFSDLDRILKSLGKTSEYNALKDAFNSNNLNGILDKLSDDLLKQAIDDVDKYFEQSDKLGGIETPTKDTRSTRFDYVYQGNGELEKVIASENARLASTYADYLETMVRDLQDGISNGDFDLVKQDAITKLNELKVALKSARDEAETLQDKMNLAESIATLESQIKDFNDNTVNNISSIASAFDRLMDGIKSIAEAFGEELEWEGLEKVMSVVNGTIQLMEAMATVIQTVQTIQDISSKKKALNAAKEVAANTAVSASETEKAAAEASAAAAGGANAVSSIPIVGPALAVAAVTAIVGALLAGMSKFATGGIVGGTSTQGDNNIIRANSGELILNKAQQGSLYKAIASGKFGGNGGEWKVRGTELIQVIKNTQNKLNG